jgi:hypothetical protein
MCGKICEMLQLCGQLAAAVVEVLEDPSCQNSRAVHEMVSSQHTLQLSVPQLSVGTLPTSLHCQATAALVGI